MREPIKDRGRLEHILEMTDHIADFMQGRQTADLATDKLLLYAVVHAITIIGEAAYKLTPDFKATHPQVPWKAIAGMRHSLIHGYYTVRVEDVQYAVDHDLQPLRTQVQHILNQITQQPQP